MLDNSENSGVREMREKESGPFPWKRAQFDSHSRSIKHENNLNIE